MTSTEERHGLALPLPPYVLILNNLSCSHFYEHHLLPSNQKLARLRNEEFWNSCLIFCLSPTIWFNILRLSADISVMDVILDVAF